jgi:LPXTG-motif cell wall-anchored protein
MASYDDNYAKVANIIATYGKPFEANIDEAYGGIIAGFGPTSVDNRSWRIPDAPGQQGFFDALAESQGFPKGHHSFSVRNGSAQLDGMGYNPIISDSPKSYTLALQGQAMADYSAPQTVTVKPVQVDVIKQDFATSTNKGILLDSAQNPTSIAAQNFLSSGQTATVAQSTSDGKVMAKTSILTNVITYKWYIIGGLAVIAALFMFFKKRKRGKK